MTPVRCLDWCHEVSGAGVSLTLDELTARNVLEWLAHHASKAAETDVDRTAISAATRMAENALALK